MPRDKHFKTKMDWCPELLSIICALGIVQKLAIYYLGLDFSRTHDDITAFEFILMDSLPKLKHACDTEIIGDFLQHAFMESGAANVLGRGKFWLKLFIYKMSREKYRIYTQQMSGKLMQQTKEPIKKIWDLFAEELDLHQLLETLNNIVQVGKDKVYHSRKQKMKSLIGRLVSMKGPDEGICYRALNLKEHKEMSPEHRFKILVAHCMKYNYNNEYLWEKINTICRGNTRNSYFSGMTVEDKSFPGQKLFTTTFTLSIEESTDVMKVDIGIQDRKWHDDAAEASKDEIVIMALKPVQESTEEEDITDAPRVSTPEPHDANKESHQSMLMPDSNRQQRGNSSNHSEKQDQKRKKIKPNAGKLHRIVLNRCMPDLVTDLDFKTVLMYIQQEELLNDVTMRDILEQKTTSDGTRELIRHIQQRDKNTYEKFKECLVQVKQAFLKDQLEEEEAKLALEIEEEPHLKRKRSMHSDDTASFVPS